MSRFVRMLGITSAIAVVFLACRRPAAPRAPVPPVPVAAATLPTSLPTPAQPKASAAIDLVDPVEQAIKRGVAYLHAAQNGRNWETAPVPTAAPDDSPEGAQWGITTATAAWALLVAGDRESSPRLQQAMQCLDDADVAGTHALAMKLHLWNYVASLRATQKKVLMKDATLLMGGVNLNGPAKGLYHYSIKPAGAFNMESSCYGVMGMHAAAMQNLEIPDKYWELVDAAWRGQQNVDGGWGDTPGAPGGPQPASTDALTAAGVAALYVTQDMLSAGKVAECKGNPSDTAIDNGLTWLGLHYAGSTDPRTLYLIGRVGRVSGYKYFGGVDWWKQGATALLNGQRPDGSWDGPHGDRLATAWAIAFLVDGRAPVLINKLRYDLTNGGNLPLAGNWNQRPRDVANFARWFGRQICVPNFNWQVIDFLAPLEEMHDSPIIFISGNQALSFTPNEKARLRQFVRQGGLILGHADCSDTKFASSFDRLGVELFPAYQFRDLPNDHLIYTVQYNLPQNDRFPRVQGISNGVRELMLLLRNDPGKFWQIRNFGSAQSKALSELVGNIYLYAGGKRNLPGRVKGINHLVPRDPAVRLGQMLKVARVDYGGNWNPEPGGWARLADVMHNWYHAELVVHTVKLGDGRLVDGYTVAHLTGTEPFQLTDAQRMELRVFVNAGGTVVIDSAGGGEHFTQAAQAELVGIFLQPAAQLTDPLPVNHAVYSAGDYPREKAAYRPFTMKRIGTVTTPHLRGITINGRTAVFFSHEDISVGLVGTEVEGVNGYAPAYATDLMARIISYAAGPSK